MKILSLAKLVQALKQLLTTKIFLNKVSLHFLMSLKNYKIAFRNIDLRTLR